MKAITLKTIAAVITLLLACTLQTAKAQQAAKADYKTCYANAKATIDSMLAGQVRPDFEKALFVTENAYWGNAIRYGAFDSTISYHAHLISQMVTAMKKQDTTKTIKMYPHEKKEDKILGHQQLQNNWGIYTYLTDTTRFKYDSTTYLHLPLQYSNKDPYGTLNWANTMVTGMIFTNHGNCYAMACMYKLLADKLHTGANIATAPGHAFIQHSDDGGTTYNMELASHSFQGDGSIEAFTYTTNKAVESGIAMRSLTDMQDISMCLVYLAKGYENRFKNDNETDANSFTLNCAETALQYDSLNLNAMLLKAEVLECKVLEEHKTVAQLQTNKTFIEYQQLIKQVYDLGYREMPIEMQNVILAKLNHDNYAALANNNQQAFVKNKLNNQNTASASDGLFDEQIKGKKTEKYHKTIFNTKTKTITAFDNITPTYTNYSTDPVVAAMSVDPITHKYPMLTPYQFASNTPIWATDLDGKEAVIVNDVAKTITIVANVYLVTTGTGAIDAGDYKEVTEDKIKNQGLTKAQMTVSVPNGEGYNTSDYEVITQVNYVTKYPDGSDLTWEKAKNLAENSTVTYTDENGQEQEIKDYRTGAVVATTDINTANAQQIVAEGDNGRTDLNVVDIENNKMVRETYINTTKLGNGDISAQDHWSLTGAHELGHLLGMQGHPSGYSASIVSNYDNLIHLAPNDISKLLFGAIRQGVTVKGSYDKNDNCNPTHTDPNPMTTQAPSAPEGAVEVELTQ